MIYSYNNISGKLIRFIQSQLTGVAKNTLVKPITTHDGVMLQGLLYMPYTGGETTHCILSTRRPSSQSLAT
jgi:hypothetical protein